MAQASPAGSTQPSSELLDAKHLAQCLASSVALAFLARGCLWEFHLSVLVTAAPGCYNLPHPSYFTKHGSRTHLGLVKESAYVTRTFLRSLNHTLALSLWTKEGVERFLAAVRNANPWFYDFHHGLYVQRLRGVAGLRIPHRYLA